MLRCEEEFDDEDFNNCATYHHERGFVSDAEWHDQQFQQAGWPISDGVDHGLVEVTLNYMLREEHQFHVTPDSWLRAQGEDGVRHWMRPPVIEWMSEVCEEYDLACLPLAISILDRYLSATTVAPAYLQTFGAAALMIASKLKDEEPPTLGLLCQCAAHHFDQEELKTAESLILHTLEWRLQSICADEILEHLLLLVTAEAGLCLDLAKIRKYATLLIEMALFDFRCMLFYPSVIACASLVYAVELAHGSDCQSLVIAQGIYNMAGAPLDMEHFAQCKARISDAFHSIMNTKPAASPLAPSASAPMSLTPATQMSPSRTPPARLAAVYESYAAASHGSSQSQHGFAPLTAPHLQAFVHNDQSAGRPRPGDISRKASYCSLTSAVTIPLADEGYSGSYDWSSGTYGSLSSQGSQADSAISMMERIDSAVHSRSTTPDEEPDWMVYGVQADPAGFMEEQIMPDATDGSLEPAYIRTSSAKRRRPDCRASDDPAPQIGPIVSRLPMHI